MVSRTQNSFPNFRPTAREFTDAEYPVKIFTTLGGVEYRRIYGDEPSGYRLRLTYVRPDPDCGQFRSHYHFCRGTFSTFTIPNTSNAWSGYSAGPSGTANDFTTDPANRLITWRYESPPQITPLPGGGQYSTVTVSLIGVVRGA